MVHCSSEELQVRLHDAAAKVEIGAHYTHFKDTAKAYVVRSLAILESTEEVVVVYEQTYGGRVSFVRPLASWLDVVEWEGETVPRFRKI